MEHGGTGRIAARQDANSTPRAGFEHDKKKLNVGGELGNESVIPPGLVTSNKGEEDPKPGLIGPTGGPRIATRSSALGVARREARQPTLLLPSRSWPRLGMAF